MILTFRAQSLAAAASPERPILVMYFHRTLALTRATRQRVLSAHGESAVLARVRVLLQAVAQR